MWERKKIRSFRAKLLRWYRRRRRDLPWRQETSPYRVWISEIMLQQTQASTVRLYYERFLKRFPDIASLAKARESDILHAWSGLGYYRRARNLQRAAKQIVDSGGIFPSDFSQVIHLPGIGRYTAGAICSIAFNQTYPVVDGNVRRVLARLTELHHRVPESYYWDWMSAWLSRRAPGNFNQGMMELGALVCTPLQPRCLQCPVRTFCRANASGTAEKIPKARTRKAVQRLGIAILLLEWNRRVLLTPAGHKAFIPGAWGLPWIQIPDQHSKEESARALCRGILRQGISLEYCGEIRHSISNRQITGFCFQAKVKCSPRMRNGDRSRWADLPLFGKLVTSSIFHKALRTVRRFPISDS